MSNLSYRNRVGMILSEDPFGGFHLITVIIAVFVSLIAMSAIPILFYAVELLVLMKIASTKWWRMESETRNNTRRIREWRWDTSIGKKTLDCCVNMLEFEGNPLAFSGENFERLYQMIKTIHRYETIIATAQYFSSQDLIKAQAFLSKNRESLRKAKENFDRLWSSILVQIKGVHELGEFIEPALDHVSLEDDDILAREIDELGDIDKQLRRLTVEAMAKNVIAERSSPYYYNHEPYMISSKRVR